VPRPLALLLLAALTGGCEERARTLEWEVRFATADLATRVVAVDASIRRGGCDGELVFQSLVVGERGSSPRGELGPGSYSFVAAGTSPDCEWVAFGCAQRELPVADGEIVAVTLVETPAGMTFCDDGMCTRGVCEGGADAGPPSFDGGPPDGGGPPDTGPSDTGPRCDDGARNGDELGIDCGGSCPTACPDWQVGGWSGCDRGTQTRTVECVDSEDRCTKARPSSSQSCAWVEYRGLGWATGPDLRAHWATRGSCTDRVACSGCSGGFSRPDCEAHCLSKVMELNRDITCERTGCTLDCRVYDGHGIDTSGRAEVIYGHAP
jgi:hypothetical protein